MVGGTFATVTVVVAVSVRPPLSVTRSAIGCTNGPSSAAKVVVIPVASALKLLPSKLRSQA